MARKPVYGDRWSESSLERASRIGKEVYRRALSRQVPFPPAVEQDFHPQDSDVSYERVSLDEAFYAMMGDLRHVSKLCQKYHGSRRFDPSCKDSVPHCERFHKSTPVRVKNPWEGNPFIRHETMYLTLPEGAYSITADKPGSQASRTTNIHVCAKDTHTHELFFKL